MEPDNQSDPYELLAQIEASGTLSDARKVRAFLCACCRLIWNKLPQIAQNALQVAETYNQGVVSSERVREEQVNLWRYLGTTAHERTLPNCEAGAIRAVISCLLDDTYFNANSGDLYEIVSFAMAGCHAVDNKDQEQYELLRQIFEI